MSTILKFPIERVQRTSNRQEDASSNANILVFEGVRYEKTDCIKKPVKPKKNSDKKATQKS